jgi:steroid delta-isomerase-like uncharacterized protein
MSRSGLTDRQTACHDAYIEAWNDHDPDGVVDQFADGGTYAGPFFEEPIAGEEIAEFVRLTAERFPDFRFEQRNVLDASDEHIRIEEWTMHGTHEGMREGLPPTGNPISLDGTSVVELGPDGIREIRAYYDQQELAEQLGLTFPTVLGQLPTMVAGAAREVL